MTISGFTFMKNTSKLYYPYIESIKSILPIVDEFIVLMGDNDSDDDTLEKINEIGSDKIKIFHSVWDREKYKKTTIFAQQTDEAMSYCQGDWLFYLQSDEVVHENDLDSIKNACIEYYKNPEVEGLLFKYYHFWGDYNHYQISNGWYKNEIRVIKNHIKDLHSWRDAQSFRIIPNFDGIDYMRKENTRKLNVIELDAHIFHYGWVRPPQIMSAKSNREMTSENIFDYGALNTVATFKDTHPKIMKNKIASLDWQNTLYEKKRPGMRHHRHMQLRRKILTFIEGILFNHKKELTGFKNYKIIGKFK